MSREKYHGPSSESRHKGPNILTPLLIFLGVAFALNYAAYNATIGEYADTVLENIGPDAALIDKMNKAILPGTRYPIMYDSLSCQVNILPPSRVQELPTIDPRYTIVDLGKTGGVLEIYNPLIYTDSGEKYFMVTFHPKPNNLNHPVFVPIDKDTTIHLDIGCTDSPIYFILSEYRQPKEVVYDSRNVGDLNQIYGFIIDPSGNILAKKFPASIGTYYPEGRR